MDYINAHGTSTEVGDRAETCAIKRAFGEHAYKVAVSSTKSMTGHLLGGAGGLEAGITVLAMRDQIAPPTINHENPDPRCDLDYVPNQARPMKIEYALSNSFGFGGTNGSLIFKRYQGLSGTPGNFWRASQRLTLLKFYDWHLREMNTINKSGGRAKFAAYRKTTGGEGG